MDLTGKKRSDLAAQLLPQLFGQGPLENRTQINVLGAVLGHAAQMEIGLPSERSKLKARGNGRTEKLRHCHS